MCEARAPIERKRNKAEPSDIILYSIFIIHYSFIKITTPKNGRGDPSPTIDKPTLHSGGEPRPYG